MRYEKAMSVTILVAVLMSFVFVGMPTKAQFTDPIVVSISVLDEDNQPINNVNVTIINLNTGDEVTMIVNGNTGPIVISQDTEHGGVNAKSGDLIKVVATTEDGKTDSATFTANPESGLITITLIPKAEAVEGERALSPLDSFLESVGLTTTQFILITVGIVGIAGVSYYMFVYKKAKPF